MRKFWTASVAAMAFTLIAAPASAQPQPWSVSGEITDSDAGGTGPHYDTHMIHLEAGTRYRISVDSSAFDAVARLYRQGSDAPVAENDDGDGLNPRLNYTPTESGDYTLRVTGFAAEGRGAYTASLATLPPLPPGQPVPWSANGRIDNDDARDGAEGPHYDEHVLRLEAGHRYTIKLDSSAFDTMARLYRAGEDNTVAEDDDGGDGTNSRISFVPEATGDFVLRVSPLANDGHGAYRASVEMAPPLPAPLTQFQRMSAMVFRVYEGALTNSDGEGGSNGARVDDYLVHFDANQERLIMLDSPGGAFDTVVQVLRADNREAEPIASNDDSGGTLNSLLQFKAEEAGDYVIRVTSFAVDGRGRYRLRVSE